MMDKGQNSRDVLRRKASLSLDPPIQLVGSCPLDSHDESISAVSAQLENSATTQAQRFDGGILDSVRPSWIPCGCGCAPSIQQWAEYNREPLELDDIIAIHGPAFVSGFRRRPPCRQRKRRPSQSPVSRPRSWGEHKC